MKSLYIKAEHVFQEQAVNEFDFHYKADISTLRKIPCRPGDIWQEGVVYEEGKDYSVGRKVESCECGNYFDPYDNGDHSGACWNCNRTKYKDVIIAKKTEPPAPPQSEGELWMKIFASVMRTNAMVALKMATGDWEGVKELTETAIADLSKVYHLSLRSDKPELFTKEQVAQLIREAFIEGFRNNGVPLGEWSDNLEGNEEQLKEYINSKLQPGVKG